MDALMKEIAIEKNAEKTGKVFILEGGNCWVDFYLNDTGYTGYSLAGAVAIESEKIGYTGRVNVVFRFQNKVLSYDVDHDWCEGTTFEAESAWDEEVCCDNCIHCVNNHCNLSGNKVDKYYDRCEDIDYKN